MTKLRQMREGRGLKLIDFSYAIRVHPTHLSCVECGKQAVSARAKEAICSFLGAEPSELFNDNGIAL